MEMIDHPKSVWDKFWHNVIYRGDYNCLTEEEIEVMVGIHERRVLDYIPEILGEDGKANIYLRENYMQLLKSFQRIVYGAHGAYIEFTEEDLVCKLEIPSNEKWRTIEPYKDNVKYIHMCPVADVGKTGKQIRTVKIYKQIKEVGYADYKPGMYYIDVFDVSNIY